MDATPPRYTLRQFSDAWASGLTKREVFAILALQSLGHPAIAEDAVAEALRRADLLLKALSGLWE